jgi:carbonic anhydrase
MEEIAKLKEPVAKTPQEAIRALKSGNSRFFGGMARRPEMSANERRLQILQQTPFAVVLGCSDSRVPVDLVYDQELGDIFAVRVAGQVVDLLAPPGASNTP